MRALAPERGQAALQATGSPLIHGKQGARRRVEPDTSGGGWGAHRPRRDEGEEQCANVFGGLSPWRSSARPLPRPPGTFADCNPPSRTVIQNYECSTALSQGSVNGYVQGQIQLGINYGVYKAFSSSEPFQ